MGQLIVTHPYTPTWYQHEDANTLLEYNHGYLWNDPGTGKTVTALEAFRRGGYDRMLVLCPKIALSMWAEEVERHLNAPVYVLRTGRLAKSFYGTERGYVLVTTHSLAIKHAATIMEFLMRGNSAITIDEAHYYKTPDAQRTKAVMGRMCNGTGGIFGAAQDVWQLTGTPITNHANDLYSQLAPGRMEILQHYNVGTYDKFLREFCTYRMVKYSHMRNHALQVTGSTNLKRLERLLDDCRVIRRKLSDVVDNLPSLTRRTLSIEHGKLNVSDRSLVKMTDAQIVAALNDPDSVLAKVRKALGVAKVSSIAEYVAQCGGPLLVGMWHLEAIAALQKALEDQGIAASVVKGGMTEKQQEQTRKQFNAGHIPVLIGQMQAMRESWNLQEAARHVIIGEEVPSPSTVTQFAARVHRKGQRQHVQLDVLHANHEIDRALSRLRNVKEANVMELLD